MSGEMTREDYRIFVRRWKLMEEVEENEIREAPFELLLRQTLSIWDMREVLGFSGGSHREPNLWALLQKKWIARHA